LESIGIFIDLRFLPPQRLFRSYLAVWFGSALLVTTSLP